MNDASPGAPRSARRWLPFALVFAATFAFQLPFFDRWYSGMDEGHLLLFSEIAAKGGTLYRDATFYPLPGAFYLLAGLFRIFEPSVLVARWAVLVEFALFVPIVHDLLRRMTPPAFALAAVPLLWAYRLWAFPHWQMYSYSTTALLLFAASLRLLVAHLENDRRAPLVESGLVFGLGVFCKQDYGAAALLATLGTLYVASRTRETASPRFGARSALFLAPAAAVGALAGVHFLLNGVLADVIRFCVLTHAVGTATFPFSSFARPWQLLATNPALRSPAGIATHFPPLVWTLDWKRVTGGLLYTRTPLYELTVLAVLYGPWLLLTVSGVRQWRSRARLRDPVQRPQALAELSLWATGAAFCALGHVAKPQDFLHFAVITWPFVALAVLEASALWHAHRRLARWLALPLLPACAAALAYTAFLAAELRLQNSEPVRLARAAGLYVEPADARLLEDLVTTIERETAPGETIAVYPYFPLLHFLADRPGPHRSGYIVWPVPEIDDREDALIDAMEAQHVRLVIYHFTQFLTLPRVETFAPKLYAYLVDHFETFATFSAGPFGYKVEALRRDDAPPPGRPLLGDAVGGTLRIERDGAPREVGGDERDAMLRREAWPFRPALALRPTAGGDSVLALPLHAQKGERLRTAVGVHPEKWFVFPPVRTTFRIAVVADGARTVLYERTLDPQRRLEDRGWFEVDAPLDAVAGRDAVLELSTSTDTPRGESPLAAGFAEPRLVAREDTR
ncbi:MAG TPA: hypothetical protein VMS55_00535 [Myxococcota bacterium]|nr:hypothetical protein [Myxococcota bacterium]